MGPRESIYVKGDWYLLSEQALYSYEGNMFYTTVTPKLYCF